MWRHAAGPDTITLDDVVAAVPGVIDQLDRRTFGPRWERVTDRQAEFLAALAIHGGQAAMADLATTLGRPRSELSWLRDQLLKEGDVYAPRYGHIAMAVPLFTPFILARYPEEREHGGDLLTMQQMRATLAGGSPRPRGPDSLRGA